jgi:hypothetical protein
MPKRKSTGARSASRSWKGIDILEITLQRLHFTSKSTCGELSVAERIGPYTLELPVKDGLPGSAIPPGRYKIELAPSPKFLRSDDSWVQKYAHQMPHIAGIPKRSLIMFHWGNTPADTDGCILVGLTHDLDMLGESRKAFESLFAVLEEPARAGECWISVQGGLPIIGDSHEEAQDAATAT